MNTPDTRMLVEAPTTNGRRNLRCCPRPSVRGLAGEAPARAAPRCDGDRAGAVRAGRGPGADVVVETSCREIDLQRLPYSRPDRDERRRLLPCVHEGAQVFLAEGLALYESLGKQLTGKVRAEPHQFQR